MASTMARIQLLMPHELKADVESYAQARGLALNEALRVLVQLGLAQQRDTAGSATALAEALLARVTQLEAEARARTSAAAN
jgi:hypothetical protein